MVVAALLVEEHLAEHVGVAVELAGEDVADEGLHVEDGAHALLGVGIVGAEDDVLHPVPRVLYVLELLGLDDVLVGLVHGDGVAVRRVEVVRLTPCVVVHLDVVAAGDELVLQVPLRHLGDVDAFAVDRNGVGQGIGAPVAAIDDEVHHLAPGCPLHLGTPRHAPGHGVAHERLVAIAVDEHVLLALGGRLVAAALHHVVALPVVVLHAEGFVLVRSRVVAAHTEQDGILLDHRAALVDEQRLRLEVLAAIGGQDVVLDVHAERGQVGDLVEPAVVACACVAVERQLGHIAIGPRSAHVADIAEAAAHVDIDRVGDAASGPLANEVEGHGVHEVGTVGTLEEAEQGTVGPLRAGCRRKVDAGDDVGLPQVEAHPLQVWQVRTEVGCSVAVEGKSRLRSRTGGHLGAFQREVHGRIIGVEER